MRLRIIELTDYLLGNIYKSKNIELKNGLRIILVKDDKGIAIVDTECGYDYSRFTKEMKR